MNALGLGMLNSRFDAELATLSAPPKVIQFKKTSKEKENPCITKGKNCLLSGLFN